VALKMAYSGDILEENNMDVGSKAAVETLLRDRCLPGISSI